MAKNLFCVLILTALVGCGGPAPLGDDVATPNDVSTEDSTTNDFDEAVFEIPPEGALPLSEIVASMEIPGHTQVVAAEFEDGVWDIEYVMGGEEYEIEVDPMTGESLPEEAEDD